MATRTVEAITATMKQIAAIADACAAMLAARELLPNVRKSAKTVAANPPKNALTDASCVEIAFK
jgi:hypothetical protein